MKESKEVVAGYGVWLRETQGGKELQDYVAAMWQVLHSPELLNKDKVMLYRVYALLHICLKKHGKQYSLIKERALQDGLSLYDLKISMLGMLIQKLLGALPGLTKKQESLAPEDFSRYLFVVSRIILGKCLSELGNEIIGDIHEKQENWVDLKGADKQISLEQIQYKLEIRSEARLLTNCIQENWRENELNVLCHELEQGSAAGTHRLRLESRDNIYQLHKRIRDKLKQTMSDHKISEAGGRLFIGKFLKVMCQKCRIMDTYKGKDASLHQGAKNERQR